MRYKEALSMSRKCPGCCAGAMERLEKYMPGKKVENNKPTEVKPITVEKPAEKKEIIPEKTIVVEKKEEAAITPPKPKYKRYGFFR